MLEVKLRQPMAIFQATLVRLVVVGQMIMIVQLEDTNRGFLGVVVAADLWGVMGEILRELAGMGQACPRLEVGFSTNTKRSLLSKDP